MPKGIHQYKFIVDGEWRFSPDEPIAHDEHGNINNILNTFDENSLESFQSNSYQKKIVSPTTSLGCLKIKNKSENKDGKSNDWISQQNEIQFADKAPSIPPHLLSIQFMKVN